MASDQEKYENYLNRAEELRAVGETMKSPETRETMFRMADDYVKMAERIKTKLP
ncbi:MAG TPA: hypothetical protein VHV26_10250 [Rhizomicrobium sp.]|jgi:hypothetical protein|nr:hypothetical protein [Rhizomicrobium sp.]